MKWFELLDNEKVITLAKQSFREHNGYEYSDECAGDPIGQRLDDAQFGRFKAFWAKEMAKEEQE